MGYLHFLPITDEQRAAIIRRPGTKSNSKGRFQPNQALRWSLLLYAALRECRHIYKCKWSLLVSLTARLFSSAGSDRLLGHKLGFLKVDFLDLNGPRVFAVIEGTNSKKTKQKHAYMFLTVRETGASSGNTLARRDHANSTQKDFVPAGIWTQDLQAGKQQCCQVHHSPGLLPLYFCAVQAVKCHLIFILLLKSY